MADPKPIPLAQALREAPRVLAEEAAARLETLEAENALLRGQLDTLEMHGNAQIVSGWVCVPVGEWEQIYG